MADIENLSIQITASETAAVNSVDKLAKTLERLKNAVNGAAPTKSEANRLRDFAQALNAFRGAENIRISSTIATQIGRIGTAIGRVTTSDIQRLRDLADALRGLNGVQTNVDLRVGGNVGQQAANAVGENARQRAAEAVFGRIDDGPNAGNAPAIREQYTDQTFNEAAEAARDAANAMGEMAGDTNNAENALNRTGNAADGAAQRISGLSSILGGVGRAARALVAIPQFFTKQMTDSIKKATQGAGQFLASIKRIAMYRLIRTAIKELTKNISEGIKNLYHWSATANGAFKNSMDKIATATQYLGNSFAAMASPLIEALAPAIDYVVDKFVDMFNIINQVFARLSGSTTYTAAKKVAAEWDDATESAKQYKNTLLGFDEINKLNDDTGGSKKKETDYGSMFETRQITGPVSQFADQLRAMVDSADWQGLGQLLGGKVNELIGNIDFAGAGAKVGAGINAWFTTKYWTLDTINFTNIGSKIAEFLNNAISKIDFNIIGRSLVQKLTIIGDLIIGFFLNFDWGQAASAFSAFVKGIYQEITKWLGTYNWGDVGNTLYQKLKDAIKNFDFGGIVKEFFRFLGTAVRSVIQLGAGFIAGFWSDICDYWDANIKADTFTDTVHNILDAIGQGFSNLATWVWKNIVHPFIAALTGDEHWEESLVDLGKSFVGYVKKGWDSVVKLAKNIGQFFVDVKDDAMQWWKNVQTWWLGKVGPVKEFWTNVKNNATAWWQNVKTWWNSKVGTVQEFITNVKNNAAAWWLNVKTWWNAKVGAVQDFVTNVRNSAGAWWQNVKTWWGAKVGAVQDFVTNVKNNASAWWLNVKTWWNDKVGSVKEFITNVKNNSVAWWQNVKSWWDAKVGSVKEFWTNVKNNASAWWNNVNTWWNSKVSAVREFWTNVKDNSNAWWQNVKSWWNDKVGPVKDFWTNVKNNASAWWQNVKTWWNDKVGAVKDFTTNVKNTASTWWSNVKKWWDEYTKGLGLDAVAEIMVKITEKVSEWFKSFWNWLRGGGDEIKPTGTAYGEVELEVIGGEELVPDGAGGFYWKKKVSTDVNVNPVLGGSDSSNGTSGIAKNVSNAVSDIFSKITRWLFGITNPSITVTVNAAPGTGFKKNLSSNKFALDGINAADVKVNLTKGNFDKGFKYWLTGDTSGKVTVSITLDKYDYWFKNNGFRGWLYSSTDYAFKVPISLTKYDWWFSQYGFRGWLYSSTDYAYPVYINLKPWNFTTLSSWLGSVVTVSVNLAKGGGVAYSNGYKATFAEGGIITKNTWRKLPKYAGGTNNAHGTLFLAGEAGPEIVGHVGGRTEILNRSQLAETMYAAVHSAMSGVRIAASFYDGGNDSYSEEDMSALAEMVRQGVENAMARQNEYMRQGTDYLRQINEKDFTAEVTTRQLNNAQRYVNRRAGTTVVAVGG